jgi:thioredoxin-like negative regulator of GroEL
MAIAWLTTSRRPATVDELVCKGRYAQAIALCRVEFERRQPSAAERLRFADLLVLAGRASEALPILLGVADEQARYGFHEKALEALRRANAIEPRRPEVTRRLEDLALTVRKALKPALHRPVDPGRDAGSTRT